LYQFSTQKVVKNDEKAKNTKNNEEKAQNFGVGEFRGTDLRVFEPIFFLRLNAGC